MGIHLGTVVPTTDSLSPPSPETINENKPLQVYANHTMTNTDLKN